MKEDTICDRTLTTFYLPAGTEKALHITSHTTTQVCLHLIYLPAAFEAGLWTLDRAHFRPDPDPANQNFLKTDPDPACTGRY